MRILFAGSPEIAVPSLRALAQAHTIVGVLTNPDSAKGRGLCTSCTPVANAAREFLPEVPILGFERLGPGQREAVGALQPDILVVFAYGRIFGPKFLALFPRGGINIHPSLLPRWRGCAPIPHAILKGDRETGISVQRIALRMDCGAILGRIHILLDGTETTTTLTSQVADLAVPLLLDTLDSLVRNDEPGEIQDESLATYCHAFSKDEGRIDWSLSAAEISSHVRAFDPWPVAWTLFGGQRLAILECTAESSDSGSEAYLLGESIPGKVLCIDKSKGIMVQTGEGRIALRRLQLPGKKALAFKDFYNGVRDFNGSLLA